MKSEIILDVTIPSTEATYLKFVNGARLMITQMGKCIRLNRAETSALIHALNTNNTEK